jgi:hypothetical protein
MSAQSLTELGEARGYKGRHAVAAGRRLLVAANDNFNEAMALAEYAVEALTEVLYGSCHELGEGVETPRTFSDAHLLRRRRARDQSGVLPLPQS